MSTPPEAALVNLLSRWLAGHAPDAEMREGVQAADREPLGPEATALVDELDAELRNGARHGDVERLVRETLEAVALGV